MLKNKTFKNCYFDRKCAVNKLELVGKETIGFEIYFVKHEAKLQQ